MEERKVNVFFPTPPWKCLFYHMRQELGENKKMIYGVTTKNKQFLVISMKLYIYRDRQG